jgi:hypothetical protein
MECKAFLDERLFTPGRRRILCRNHINEYAKKYKAARWLRNPMTQKAYYMWQTACMDSLKLFKTTLEMNQGEVLGILEANNINLEEPVRVVPVDPTKPISKSNFCLTTVLNRSDMYKVWRKFHSVKEYRIFIGPDRPVYASSSLIT